MPNWNDNNTELLCIRGVGGKGTVKSTLNCFASGKAPNIGFQSIFLFPRSIFQFLITLSGASVYRENADCSQRACGNGGFINRENEVLLTSHLILEMYVDWFIK